jgi:hypothetical protein
MPPKRKEKKRKNRITYLSARSVKAVDCDDAWNSTYARPKALRPWRPPVFLPSFLPSPRLVYSFTLRTAAPASDLFVNSFTKPLLHAPSAIFFSRRNFFLIPCALQTLPLPLPLLPTYFDLFPGWLYSSISCLPVTWFVDNLFGNSVIPSTNKSAPAVKKFSALRMAEEEEEEEL